MSESQKREGRIAEIEDWFHHPFTRDLIRYIEAQCETVDEGRKHAYIRGEPHRTQERLAEMTGHLIAFSDIWSVLSDIDSQQFEDCFFPEVVDE